MAKKEKVLDSNAKPKILTTKSMMYYSLGILGVQLGIGLVNSFQAEFFNSFYKLDLTIIAAIILAAKVISIAADFIIGNLIDRSHFKGGKMRPWVLISAAPLLIFTMLSFVLFPIASEAGKIIYILFVVVLWNISMSLADIPSQGMLALLSPDADERNNCAGIANVFKSVGLASPGVFVTVVLWITSHTTAQWTDYVITAAIMCGLGFIFMILLYKNTEEHVVSMAPSATSLKDTFKEIKSNKMIVLVAITYILGFARTFGLSIAAQASMILSRGGMIIGNLYLGAGDKCSWLIGLTSGASSLVAIILNPWITKKLGEKKYFITFGIYGFVVALVAFLLYAFDPTPNKIFRSLWAILIYQFILGPAFGPNNYLPLIMTSDIVDYQEWKTGKRSEGATFSVLSLSFKLSNALSVFFAILLIGSAFVGFNSAEYKELFNTLPKTLAEMSAAERDSIMSSVVTDEMQVKAWAVYYLIPGICFLLAAIPMFWYKIDEKTKVQMRAELAERHAQAAAQAEQPITETPVEA